MGTTLRDLEISCGLIVPLNNGVELTGDEFTHINTFRKFRPDICVICERIEKKLKSGGLRVQFDEKGEVKGFI